MFKRCVGPRLAKHFAAKRMIGSHVPVAWGALVFSEVEPKLYWSSCCTDMRQRDGPITVRCGFMRVVTGLGFSFVCLCASRVAEESLRSKMTIHTYEHSDEDSVGFEAHIREALKHCEEPVLKIASNLLLSRPDGHIITRQDYRSMKRKVEWDLNHLHAVVIGSESMKETNQMLVLKDSNWEKPWKLQSIADIDWIDGAQVRALLYDVVLHRWRVCSEME